MHAPRSSAPSRRAHPPPAQLGRGFLPQCLRRPSTGWKRREGARGGPRRCPEPTGWRWRAGGIGSAVARLAAARLVAAAMWALLEALSEALLEVGPEVLQEVGQPPAAPPAPPAAATRARSSAACEAAPMSSQTADSTPPHGQRHRRTSPTSRGWVAPWDRRTSQTGEQSSTRGGERSVQQPPHRRLHPPPGSRLKQPPRLPSVRVLRCWGRGPRREPRGGQRPGS